jgi:hypothetical protein
MRKITRLQFGQLLYKAWESPLPPVSGFKATGIHPLYPSAIPEHAFSMSQRHVNDEAGQL